MPINIKEIFAVNYIKEQKKYFNNLDLNKIIYKCSGKLENLFSQTKVH